jgi:hypothetical protein
MSGSVNIHGLALKAPTTLTIASGVITVTQNLHIIAAESGTADNLDTIELGYDALSIDSIEYYPVLIIQANTGDTITIKHGTGNIDLPGDADIPLGDDEWILLMWNGTAWQTISGVAFA